MSDALKTTLGTRIKEFLTDVTTLDVLTVSGSMSLTQPEASDGDAASPAPEGDATQNVEWDTLFAKMTSGMTPDEANKLEVVAYTHAKWDCDSVNFVKKGAEGAELTLIENHHKAVEAAHRSRFEALQFIGKAIEKAIG